MSKKLSPYGRKEWNRKHSDNKGLKKGIDSAFRGTGSAVGTVAKMKAPDSTLEERERLNLSRVQLFIAIVVGAIPAIITVLASEKITTVNLLVVFFFFAIPFFTMVLIFKIFNAIVRPKKSNAQK